ncbi:MAG TPA: SpoIVB peptidase S55 domain-containing protein [Polyangiaceae bacterium]|nr:SpoIVB peptidase S55 domain-containing protein [Polyangiaceae bacterium]
MRSLSIIPLFASLGLLASVPLTLKLARAVPAGSEATMPVSEIKTGMKGYGLTVFRGTEPERFDVEVLGVIKQFRPHQDLVLIKTAHPRLEVAKVVAGMSGSPVFINGRMIGAYAYGWTFGAEPIAGVTPIQSMLDELARPLPIMKPLPMPAPIADARSRRPDRDEPGHYQGNFQNYDLREHARQLASRAFVTAGDQGPKLTPVSTPILLGGLTDGAAKVARDLLEPLGLDPVQGGGAGDTAAADAPLRYVNGGAIGVQMVRGDVSAMGLGTVTRVEGDKLVAFGHPMMNAGVSAMPTAIGRVLWVLASQQRSFKLGEAVRPLGALVNDRQAAIVVDSKSVAPSFPATVDIEGVEGAPHKKWSFTIAHDKFMSPSFVALAVGSAIEATTSERRDVSWRATTEIAITGQGTIKLEDAGVAVGGTPDSDDWSRSRAVRAVGALLNNPWQPARIERISTKIAVRFARDSVRLRGVDALTEVVDAGRPARLRLHLVPFAGPEETKIIEVPVPRELADKDVDIELSPGYAETPELPSPESIADLVANLPRQSYPIDSVVASIKLAEHGVAFKGQIASRLPPGALDTLRPASDTAAPEPFVSYVRTAIPIHRLLEGKDRVRVRVRTVLQ